jgi:thiol-disulfide isomerase/thioredoxin
VLVLVAVLLATTALGLFWRGRQGRVRDVEGSFDLLTELGEEPGERATLLQFSSAFCAPCRATKRVLADVAQAVPGVRHVEVDAESHLDVVRRLNILKTPTTLVLDARGNVTQRAAGQPRKEQILAALTKAVG